MLHMASEGTLKKKKTDPLIPGIPMQAGLKNKTLGELNLVRI